MNKISKVRALTRQYSNVAPAQPKRHRFRNFLMFSALVLSAGYGGALYYSTKNERFGLYFAEYAPFASTLMDKWDDYQFRQRGKSQPIVAAVQKVRESVKIGGDSKCGANKLEEPVPKAEKPAVAKVEKKKADKPPTKKPAQSEKTPAVEKVVKAPIVSKVVSETPGVDPLLQDLQTVVDLLVERSDQKFESLVAAATAANEKVKQLREQLKLEYEQRLNHEKSLIEDKNEREYFAAKHNLVESYNNRLQAALNAISEKAVAAANNRIEAQYVELNKKFNAEINDRVENERDGRLGQLSELKKDVQVLEEAMLKSGQVLESEDGIVSFFLELANLQRALNQPKSVPLRPYLTKLQNALPSDPLVKSVIDAVPATVKQNGVLSHSQLAARFLMLEPEIRKASLVAPDGGVGAHLSSVVLSNIVVPKQGFPEGNDVESIIARTKMYLQQNDVTSAVSEVNSLQSWPKKVAADWLDEGRKRSEIEFLVNVLSDEGRLWSISRK